MDSHESFPQTCSKRSKTSLSFHLYQGILHSQAMQTLQAAQSRCACLGNAQTRKGCWTECQRPNSGNHGCVACVPVCLCLCTALCNLAISCLGHPLRASCTFVSNCRAPTNGKCWWRLPRPHVPRCNQETYARPHCAPLCWPDANGAGPLSMMRCCVARQCSWWRSRPAWTPISWRASQGMTLTHLYHPSVITAYGAFVNAVLGPAGVPGRVRGP